MTVHFIQYPFVRCRASVFDGEGYAEIDSWKPGITYIAHDHYGEDTEAIAHGLGLLILTEVSRHKPGRYPERVFYTRAWQTPDGVTFGKPALRVATAALFAKRCTGYAHEFRVFDEGRPV